VPTRRNCFDFGKSRRWLAGRNVKRKQDEFSCNIKRYSNGK
jgi:hypothetical protein